MSVLAPITDSVSTMRGWSYLPALRNNSLPRLTDQGLQKINDLAQHYGVSADAVMTLLQALLNSKGTMAQFDHRELGGAGQWMPGGMTMVGDMFNHGLKAKVDGLSAGTRCPQPNRAACTQHNKSASCLFSRLGTERFVGNFGRVADARSLSGAAFSLQLFINRMGR
jgi:hypothetical protein